MKLFLSLLTIIMLSGCSTQQAVQDTTQLNPLNWIEHANQIKQIKNWQSSARIAIKIDNKTQTASMHWLQQQEQFKIDFSGPFGQRGLELIGDDQSVTLNIAQEAPISGKNTSDILRQRLGWNLPVENVKHWILGLPSPLSKSKATLKNERLSNLIQDGWNISYPKYKRFGEQFLPAKIVISKDNTRFLLAIYKWDIHPATNQL